MRRVFCLLCACLWFAAACGSARGDAAAGRAAYEKGDYAQAMSEWQRGADKSDADAEFGLGQLYEFGLGDLTQSYKKADYWYRLAAKQGHSEAEYRLALIWSAGSADLSPDLVEADQWAVLAAASQGVWGSLAGDLKAQIEGMATPQQQAEGKKRADAWKAAVAVAPPPPPAPTQTPAVATTGPRPAPGAPVKSSGGCPGWPFPTLPCTEQFPALPGVLPPKAPPKPSIGSEPAAAPHSEASPIPPAPPHAEAAPIPPAPRATVTPVAAPAPAAAAARPIDRLNIALAQIDCAALEARAELPSGVLIAGNVPDAEARAKLLRVAAQLFPGRRTIRVDLVPPPVCRPLAEFAALRQSGAVAETRFDLKLADGGAELHQGDAIEVSVGSPGYAADLRIDYFLLNGSVRHLWPNTAYPAARTQASGTRLFWDAGAGKTWNVGDGPFGTELIAAIASPAPLGLGPRPPSEPAADYLAALRRALTAAPAPAATPNQLALLLIKTARR